MRLDTVLFYLVRLRIGLEDSAGYKASPTNDLC